MRQTTPCTLISQGGDIDNRLKTLFDALRMPPLPAELPSGDAPQQDEDPFFCLLQDDALITEIDVKTGVLLNSNAQQSEAYLFIRVRTETVNATYNNIGL